MNNIAQYDEQLHDLKQVLKQDASINEAANRAGVEGQTLADYAGDVTRSRGADLVLFVAGGALATALAIGLQRKYQRPTQRGMVPHTASSWVLDRESPDLYKNRQQDSAYGRT